MHYLLDDEDRIVSVSEDWQGFADENDSSHLTPASVIGQSLWRYLTDDATSAIYQALFKQVRQGNPITFQIRCDAPVCKRLLQISLELAPDGLIRVTSTELNRQIRPPMPGLGAPLDGECWLACCSWCNKVRMQDDVWVEVEDVIGRLGLFVECCSPRLTHGICPECTATFRQLAQMPEHTDRTCDASSLSATGDTRG